MHKRQRHVGDALDIRGNVTDDCGFNTTGATVQFAEDTIIIDYDTIIIVVSFIPWGNQFNNSRSFELDNSGYSVVEPIDNALRLIKKYNHLHSGAVNRQNYI